LVFDDSRRLQPSLIIQAKAVHRSFAGIKPSEGGLLETLKVGLSDRMDISRGLQSVSRAGTL
jgi:hypothetical protein